MFRVYLKRSRKFAKLKLYTQITPWFIVTVHREKGEGISDVYRYRKSFLSFFKPFSPIFFFFVHQILNISDVHLAFLNSSLFFYCEFNEVNRETSWTEKTQSSKFSPECVIHEQWRCGQVGSRKHEWNEKINKIFGH
jgi:hypothetical protein